MDEDKRARILWAKFLLLNLKDARGKPIECYSGAANQCIREARDWFRRNDNGVGSLNFVCQVLHLNPTVVRKKALYGSALGPDIEDLAKYLRDFRRKHLLNQKSMAELAGTSHGTISNIECRRVAPDRIRDGLKKRLMRVMQKYGERVPEFAAT